MLRLGHAYHPSYKLGVPMSALLRRLSVGILTTAAVLVLAASVTGPVSAATTTSRPHGQHTSAKVQAPLSASGCSGSACIYLNGSGLFVAYVKSSFQNYSPKTVCGYPVISYYTYDNFSIRGPHACASPGGVTVATTISWTHYFNFYVPNQSRFCTHWNLDNGTQTGDPCETVHS